MIQHTNLYYFVFSTLNNSPVKICNNLKQINNKIIFGRVKVYGKLSKISKICKKPSWGNGDIVNFTDQTEIREKAITYVLLGFRY